MEELPGDDQIMEINFPSRFNETTPKTASLLNASNVNTSFEDMPSWIGDLSLHHPCRTKRKREGKETATGALTSNSDGDGLVRGHEVFLSFRGPDTRLTIADCLYEAMIRAGIRAFKDNPELRVSEVIGGNLLQAINDSKIYIPIFSKDYASSKWCLRELAQMVECMRVNNEKVILPVFFDVDADDVKLKTELYRKALQKHESDSGKNIVKWEDALREVARIKGRNLKDHGLYELTHIMVEEVSNLLWTRRTDAPDHLVGIEHPKNEIMKRLEQGALDVRFIVIHGMGGIGKTTLAKAIFKQISPQFQGHCCFLADVRHQDTLTLKKKLLSDILNLRYMYPFDDDEGANMIKKRFCGMKVLTVLDDIDKQNQITRLAGEPNWFGGGSRIIITTRNIDFLVTECEDDNVPASHSRKFSFYEMPEMDPEDALQLFSERALGRAKPPLDYISISSELISALGRLPLALDVTGSTLRGKSRSTWEDYLQKLKKVMHKDVKEKLMISFEALDDCQRQIYLDIACFLVNKEKTIAIKYWDAIFKYPTRIEVKRLQNMSLIKIIDDKLWMHDQLRDLGKDINIQMGSRLWDPKEAFDVVQREKGTENIVALNLGTPEPNTMYSFKYEEFSRIVNLRFLQLDHGNFEGDFKHLFSELRWLSWSNCPSKSQATNFGFENLVVLELYRVNITEDWGGWCHIMVAKQLTVLKLVNCPSLRKTPEFSTISRLERLILRECTGLTEIDESIGSLQYLDYLEIGCDVIESTDDERYLSKLRAHGRLLVLPHSIGNLVKLKHLFLRCSKVRELPDSIGQLKSLHELDVQFSEIRELPHSIGNLERLEFLRITNCKLEKLPDSIGRLQSLLELQLYESEIENLPDCIGNLTKLKVVDLSETFISELPKTIGMLENLERLHAIACPCLEGEIPSEIGALSSLRCLDLICSDFCRLPTAINQLTNLQELYLSSDNWIQLLPELPKSLTELFVLSTSLTRIPDLSNMTNLNSAEMHGTPMQEYNIEWIGRLPALRTLRLLVEDITWPPTFVSSLSQLEYLEISCVDLRSLSGFPSSLRWLSLADVQSPIDWSLFSNLENLSRLSLRGYRLGEIQFDVLEKLQKFKCLKMWECPLLKTLSIPPCFKEIRRLDLTELPQLTEIQGLGELKSLQELWIEFCNSIKSLTETPLFNLQNLKSLKLVGCESLESVPDVPYTNTSCVLFIADCPRLRDFCGPYRSYRDG